MQPGNMDHGGEAAPRPTTVGSTNLGMGMAAAVLGGEVVHLTTGTFGAQLGAAAVHRASFDGFEPTVTVYHNSAELARHVHAAAYATMMPLAVAVFHREPGPGVAYANIRVFWRRPGPAGVLLVGPQLPSGVMPVQDNYYGYSALQPRPGAGLGVVHPDGVAAVYNGDNSPQPPPGAGHGKVLVDLLPVPDSVEHGEVLASRLPGGYDNYGYYTLQPRSGAGHEELVGMVFDNSGNFAQQALPSTERADGIAGMLRDPNLGPEYDGSGTLADDLRAVVAGRLRRLLPFAGIVASSVAMNGLATGPGSPAVAFHLFVLFLSGLFLVILHVLRV